MAAYSALNELVIALAHWTPLETTASLITKAVKEGLQAALPQKAREPGKEDSSKNNSASLGPSYAAMVKNSRAKPNP